MDSPLSKLTLDYWYKLLIVVCFTVFLLSGLGLLKNFPTAPTVLLSLGGFFIGVGEWNNHPLQTQVYPANAYYGRIIAQWHPRRPGALGNSFLLLGIVLIGCGVYKLLR